VVERARQEEVGVFEHAAVEFKTDDGLATQLQRWLEHARLLGGHRAQQQIVIEA